MSASLPEQTAELWVATVIATHFPNAEIWAPTPADLQHFDIGARAGGKLFILECKRTDPLKTGHTIPIDVAQLGSYLAAPQYAAFKSAIYYVLPQPPWAGTPAPKPIPKVAANRTSPIGCELWMYVIPTAALGAALAGAKSVNTTKLPGGPNAAVPPGPALAAACQTLDAFLKNVKSCTEGLLVPARGAPRGPQQPPARKPLPFDEGPSAGGSSVAVFVPTSDLT